MEALGAHDMATLTPQRRPTERRRSRTRRQDYMQSADAIARVERWTPAYRTSWIKVASLIVLLACLGVLLYFYFDDRFYVSQVDVTGNKLLTAEEILTGTGCANWNVFWVDDRQVEANLQLAFPSIRTVRVRSGLPARLMVDITERNPQIVWEAANGRFLVDDEGIVLKPTEDLEEMIVIKDGERASVQLGQALPIVAAIQTATALRALLGHVRVFGYTAEKGIISNNPEGYQVFFGVGGDLALKVATLNALIAEIARDHVYIDYVDVRFEKSPVYGVSR